MSLLFWDSFDHYATAHLAYKYTSVGGSATIGAYGRHGTNGLQIASAANSYVRRALPTTPTTFAMGMAIYNVTMPSPGEELFSVADGSTYQPMVFLNNDGSLSLYRGLSTEIDISAPGVFSEAQYHYVELKATIGNAGTAEVWVDDIRVINFAGDTQETGNNWITQIKLGHYGAAVNTRWYDDLYVCDMSGSYCNDRLGDIRVIALFPDADGVHTDWTPSAGADHYAMVDEADPDDDATYNSSATPTDRDTFEFDDLPVGIAGTVHAACAVICSRKDDAGTRTLEPSVRVGGTDYDGTPVNIPNTYGFHNMYAWETNPDIAAPWTVATINAIESGYELAA